LPISFSVHQKIINVLMYVTPRQGHPVFLKWVASGLSLIAALLAALQTFFNAAEARSKHRELANRYLGVNRAAEILIAEFNDSIRTLEELAVEVRQLNQEYDSINHAAQEYPTVDRDWERAKRKIGKPNRANKQLHSDGPPAASRQMGRG
jgi:hypothetical protein